MFTDQVLINRLRSQSHACCGFDLLGKRLTKSLSVVRDPNGKEIKLPANLRDWLLPHATKKTPFRGKNWRRDFDALKRQLGFGNPAKLPRRKKQPETAEEKATRLALKPWTPDILRHTAISHHLAYFQHEGKTAAWAGNSPDIIQRHYKGLVKLADAKEFWDITPDSLENHIHAPLLRAAA